MQVEMNSPSPLAGESDGSAMPPAWPEQRGALFTRHWARAEGVGGRGGESLLERAKWMRANPTPAERRLWSMLRNKRIPVFKFERQLVIVPYIADFVCLQKRLIIEADGSQHVDSEYDQRRDAFLRRNGFHVLRFWNNDILLRSSGVFDAIHTALSTPLPPTAARRAPPSPARGEGLHDR